MKAVVIRKFGGPEVLEVVQQWPKPVAGKDEVLLRVHATSVNPIDWKTRSGALKLLTTLPKILAGDVSGTVVEAAQGGKFNVGDEVFGCGPGNRPNNPYGALAEFHAVPEKYLVAKPAKLSWQEAAAIPLASMTAWQALEPAFPLKGKRVLVHAGAGGVGSAGVQIAKALGAHVTTTCGPGNVEFVTKELGADVAIDYKKDKFELVSEPFDAVLDVIGGDYEGRSLKVLKKSGHFGHVLNSGLEHQYGRLAPLALLGVVARAKLLEAIGRGPKYTVVLLDSVAKRGLEQITALVEEGKFKVVIDSQFPLEETRKAHERSETGHVRGKVVVNVGP